MIESELNSLEQKIDHLIESFQQLNVENSSLRKKLDHLSHERTISLDQKKKVAVSLKKIIMQLQDELLCKTK
jgi:uncharacterized protein (TIGR02449 family)